MEGSSGTWDCDECGWWHNSLSGESGQRIIKKTIWRLMEHLPVNNGLEDVELFHVGMLGGAAGHNTSGNQEGPHLSVSMHPDDWTMIAKLGGQNTYRITNKMRPYKLMAFLEMEDEHKDLLLRYAVQEELLVPVTAFKVPVQRDEDSDDYDAFMMFDDREVAEYEAEELVENDPDYPGIEEVSSYVASDMLNAYWSARHNEIDNLAHSGAVEAAICYLVEMFSDFDGVWFWEDYNPYAYSCPRGLIFQSRLKGFIAADEDVEVELKPDFRTMLRYPEIRFPESLISCPTLVSKSHGTIGNDGMSEVF